MKPYRQRYPLVQILTYPFSVLKNPRDYGDELKKKYGEAPVAVTFTVGGGRVIHMISHYYLQRSEFRTERQMKGAESYAAEKGIAPAAAMKSELKDLSLGEVESAYSSAQFFANILVEQRKQVKKMESGEKEKAGKEKKEE